MRIGSKIAFTILFGVACFGRERAAALALPQLDGPGSVVVVDDSLYVVASNSKAVFHYRRDPGSGVVYYPEVVQEGVDCTNCLSGPGTVIASPDGKNVYVGSPNPAQLAVFKRGPGGTLTFQQGLENNKGGISGIWGAGASGSGLAFSPDGNHLYVPGPNDHALVVFARSSTGDLTFQQKKTNQPSPTDGLTMPYCVAVSPPPGRFVYLSDFTGTAVAVYERVVDPTSPAFGNVSLLQGYLTTNHAFTLTVDPLQTHLYVAEPNSNFIADFGRTPSGSNEGLLKPPPASIAGSGAYQAAISPGPAFAHLYVPNSDADSVTAFRRDPGGALVAIDTVTDATTHCLDLPDSIAFSADGRFVYIAALGGGKGPTQTDSLAVFSRNTDPASVDYGKLTLIQCERRVW